MTSSDTNYYMLIASTQMDDDGKDIPASAVFDKLIETGKWFLGKSTPFRVLYDAGDKVVFYLAGHGHRYFVASAIIAGAPREISNADRQTLADLGLFGYDLELPLADIDILKQPKPIQSLVSALTFIKDKKNYGLYMRHGAVRLCRDDYESIVASFGTS